MLRPLRRLLITGLLLTLSVAARAAPPPAGTLISNTAGGSFTDHASGGSGSLRANTVNATVLTRSTAPPAGPPGAPPHARPSRPALHPPPGAPPRGPPSTPGRAPPTGGGAAPTRFAAPVKGGGPALFVLSLIAPPNTRFAGAHPVGAGPHPLSPVRGTAANSYVTAVPAG